MPPAAGPPTCDLVALVFCDYGSIVRGRSVPSSEFERRPQAGVGWVPSAQARPPFGQSVDPNPFGPIGDVCLVPDAETHVSIAAAEGWSALEFVLCDMVQIDGRPWECCPRAFLRDSLCELEKHLGARVLASFEHEFQLLLDVPPAPPMSLDAQRSIDPFPARVMGALTEAGVVPERFVAERSPHQFEIPVGAAEGLAGADRSVTLREVVREVARRQGMRASFVPLLDPEEQGNGVHIHLSLLDADGRPLFYDAGAPACLSELGGRFAAGILAHARALSALTAPSPVSGARLRPNRRSAGAVCLGQRNREALLRIPPVMTFPPHADPASQLRLEYRGADAAANPYLALGALIRAGVWGVQERLPAPPILDRDPAQLRAEEIERYCTGVLPATLGESLAALAEDEAACGWMPSLLREVYTSVKRAEVEATEALDLAELCRRYAAIY